MSTRAPLRVGLLVDGMTQPAWIRSLVAGVQSSEFAEIALVVLNDSPPAPRKSFREKLASYARNFLYLSYSRMDNWRFREEPDPFMPMDMADVLVGVPQLAVRPRQTKYSDYFEPEDIARIRDYQLDVLVRLGFRILKGEVLGLARFGVWSYHHGDNHVKRGGPAGFWEVAEGDRVTGCVLQILSEELDNGRVIYRSYSSTNRYSVCKNRRSYYWKSAAFVKRKLRDLQELGQEGIREEESFVPYGHRLYRHPSNAEMLRVIPRIWGRYARQALGSVLAEDQWFMAYKLGKRGTGAPDVPRSSFYDLTILTPPADRFWADPFPIQRDGRYFVFFEEYLHARAKGHISVLEIDGEGRAGIARIALETPHHLSYPNVFDWNGELYMFPESAERGRLELYRCARFPDCWEPAAVLLEGRATTDPTLAKIGGKWWLFLTAAEPGTNCWDDELFLFSAETPFGPWRPHPRNPVKSDVRSSRPAGRIFTQRGRIYRPAQDCSVRYGWRVTINEILQIDENTYREVPVSVLDPEWRPGLLATHTLNSVGNLTVVDGQRRRAKGFRGTFSR